MIYHTTYWSAYLIHCSTPTCLHKALPTIFFQRVLLHCNTREIQQVKMRDRCSEELPSKQADCLDSKERDGYSDKPRSEWCCLYVVLASRERVCGERDGVVRTADVFFLFHWLFGTQVAAVLLVKWRRWKQVREWLLDLKIIYTRKWLCSLPQSLCLHEKDWLEFYVVNRLLGPCEEDVGVWV